MMLRPLPPPPLSLPVAVRRSTLLPPARLAHRASVHSWITHMVFWGMGIISISLFLCYSYIYYPDKFILPNAYNWNQYYGFADSMFIEPAWWLAVVITIVLGLSMGIASKAASALKSISYANSMKSAAALADSTEKRRMTKALSVAQMHMPVESEMQRYLDSKNHPPPEQSVKSGFAFSVDDATSRNIWRGAASRRAARLVTRFRTLTTDILGGSPPTRPSMSSEVSLSASPPSFRFSFTGRMRATSKGDGDGGGRSRAVSRSNI